MCVKSLQNRSKFFCDYRSYFILERQITLYLSFQKPRECPSSFSSFLKRLRARSKSWLCLTWRRVSMPWPALSGSWGDLAQGQLRWLWRNHTWSDWWNLSSESFTWQRANLGKGKSRRDAGVKGRWVRDKERITRYGGPVLGNTETNKKLGKTRIFFWLGPFKAQNNNNNKGCFYYQQFLKYLALLPIRIHPREILGKKLFKRKWLSIT